jgi:hypothetical protein
MIAVDDDSVEIIGIERVATIRTGRAALRINHSTLAPDWRDARTPEGDQVVLLELGATHPQSAAAHPRTPAGASRWLVWRTLLLRK